MSANTIKTEPHALYRFFDQADRLLYIGLTANPGRRFEQHRGDKPWWQQVARITLDVHPDRPTVLAAERSAIAAERPLHNIHHNADPHGSRAETDVAGEWPVAVHDVVALGLDADECPVGQVTAARAFGPTVALLSWWSGSFDDEMTVPWSRILQVKHGYLMSEGQKRREGWAPGVQIYDCEPLARFQTFWTAGRGQAGRDALQDRCRDLAAMEHV